MVGERKIPSAPEGPEDLQNRSQPRKRWVILLAVAGQPTSGASECLAQEGTSRLRRVQAVGPATEGRGIGQAIRVFERGCCLFPGAVLNKTTLQGLTTRQQAVMRIRKRKRREKGKGFSATWAATAPDLDPVVMRIVRLLAASPVTRDRIALANWASAQDDLVGVVGPVSFELVRRSGKWDKKNRSSSGLCSGVDLPKI